MHIDNNFFYPNVVDSITISSNIENLRYVDVYFNNGVYDIKLDISQSVPENLCAFNIHTEEDMVHKYGTIDGTVD